MKELWVPIEGRHLHRCEWVSFEARIRQGFNLLSVAPRGGTRTMGKAIVISASQSLQTSSERTGLLLFILVSHREDDPLTESELVLSEDVLNLSLEPSCSVSWADAELNWKENNVSSWLFSWIIFNFIPFSFGSMWVRWFYLLSIQNPYSSLKNL